MQKLNVENQKSYWFPSSDKSNDQRPLVGLIVLILCFSVIAVRLFYLQVINGIQYRQQAHENTSYVLTQIAPRGIIYDRNGKVLASNKQSPSVVVLPSVLLKHNVNEIAATLGIILQKPEKEVLNKLKELKENDSRPITLYKNLTLDQVSAIHENQLLLPGVTVQQQFARYYLNGDLLSHVLGYTGEVGPNDLKKDPDKRLHDIIGKYGVEKIFDNELRGTNAYQSIRVNRYGQPIERVNLNSIEQRGPKSGKDMTLTVDLDLQKAAEEALGEIRGAVVAANVKTGEVLVMASKPSFDPNVFTAAISGNLWQQMNSKQAFLNRAISAYPPGSIWKPTVLLAALEAGAVKPGETIAVSGAYYMGSTRFGDWTSSSGVFTLEKCLAWSRDTAFYKMAVRMTDKDITKWAKILGAGSKTGIEFPDESAGLVPDENWKAKHLKSGWFPGYTLHYSIGQGYLLLTPVQALRMTMGIANGDRVPQLTIIKQLGNSLPTKKKEATFSPTPEYLKIVRNGMLECVDSGTGGASKIPGVNIAGKTGSAEAPPNHRTHGWFVSYAPFENPEIAIVVFGEAAGHGGSIAAPIAKKVYTAYFTKYHGLKNGVVPPKAPISTEASTSIKPSEEPLQDVD